MKHTQFQAVYGLLNGDDEVGYIGVSQNLELRMSGHFMDAITNGCSEAKNSEKSLNRFVMVRTGLKRNGRLEYLRWMVPLETATRDVTLRERAEDLENVLMHHFGTHDCQTVSDVRFKKFPEREVFAKTLFPRLVPERCFYKHRPRRDDITTTLLRMFTLEELLDHWKV